MGSAMLALLLFAPACASIEYEAHPYARGHSDVDMPISLAVGAVRTPEFPVVAAGYVIEIQVEKPLPFDQIQCMLGFAQMVPNGCAATYPVIQGDWAVSTEGRIVAKGLVESPTHGKWTNSHVYRYLDIPECDARLPSGVARCGFLGEAGRYYVLEARFTRDVSALDVAHPHLIVTRHEWR